MIRPTSFYSVIAPLFYISIFNALTPFKVGAKYEKSKIILLWNLTFLLFEVIGTLVILTEELDVDISMFTQVPQIINAILNPLCVGLFISFQCFHRNKLLKIIADIDTFDQESKEFLNVDLSKEYRRNKILVLVLIVGIIIYNVLSFSYTILIQGSLTYEYLNSFVAYVIPTGIISLMCLQCCLIFLFFKNRIYWLNRKLVETISEIENQLPEVKRQLGTSEEPGPNNLEATLINKIAFVIETCRTKHFQLCQISNEVNSVYSMQILLIIFKDFVILITGLFFNGRILMYFGVIERTYAIYSVIQLGLPVMQLLALTIICSSITYEASKTGCLIYNLIRNVKSRENKLKTQITFFSLQILHQPVKFTACRLFVINETLLMVMVGAISTYLVIVIQFQIGDEPIN